MAEIAVIIVNYGTADLAIEAAGSVLARAHGGRDVEIWLIDNASPGDDAARLEAAAQDWGDRVTLRLETVNHGFGRGNNVALTALAARETPPDYVFLLNPDAQLASEALSELADFLDAHPKAAVAGARIEKPGAEPVTAAFRFPSRASTFASAAAFGPVSRFFSRSAVALGPDIPTGPVDWVAGAAMMARLDALQSVDFFDPGYFLYYEEVDLMRNLREAGWETWYVAEALVEHREGAATGVKGDDRGRPQRPSYWYQSWRRYFARSGRIYALSALALWVLGDALNRAISLLRGLRPAAPARLHRDLWTFVARPLLGLKEGR